MLTSGDATFKSRNSTSMMNFPVNGTSICQINASLFLSCLSMISAWMWMGEQHWSLEKLKVKSIHSIKFLIRE